MNSNVEAKVCSFYFYFFLVHVFSSHELTCFECVTTVWGLLYIVLVRDLQKGHTTCSKDDMKHKSFFDPKITYSNLVCCTLHEVMATCTLGRVMRLKDEIYKKDSFAKITVILQSHSSYNILILPITG